METKNIKLTDNEIIKALECCSSAKTADDCEKFGCPAFSDPQKCIFADSEKVQGVIDGALDLINRQKAKIEALEMDNKQLENDNFNANMNCEHLQAEVERLQSMNQAKLDMIHDLQTDLETAKIEAAKEFAHKIESYKTGIFIKGEELIILPLCDFEEIKSEMAGEDK